MEIKQPADNPDQAKTYFSPKLPHSQKLLIFSLFLVVFLLFGAWFYFFKPELKLPFLKDNVLIPTPFPFVQSQGVRKFTSDLEYKEYLQNRDDGINFGVTADSSFITRNLSTVGIAPSAQMGLPALEQKTSAPERISTTNVQVVGVDEPDIVKTDGRSIFTSLQNYYALSEPVIMPDQTSPSQPISKMIAPVPPIYTAGTKIINALPIDKLSQVGSIDKNGELLLRDNILVVFSGKTIFGYDVADPAKPTEKWQISLKDNTSIVSSRLSGDRIYLVTQTYDYTDTPCPIVPMAFSGKELSIRCTDIYRPITDVSADSTFTASVVDIRSGNDLGNVSFVGQNGTTVIYQSTNNLYITYSGYMDYTELYFNFIRQKAADLVPSEINLKLENLAKLDISRQAKNTELQVILQKYYASLSSDDRLKVQNEFQNRYKDYAKEHIREFETTGIVKISLDGFKIETTGVVPGVPLNQFSMDEYNGNLRIATTIGQRGWGVAESVNDVYVLDKNLKVSGQVLDLGVGEKIYSARFIEDKGYVVTFRETDPFYVLDLSNPASPSKKGELKIPGFSSYLHPLAPNRILGVGREGQNVKLSLFDVSNPATPLEVGKYNLDEFWTEVQNTHHAFLLDDKHGVFFMPGSKGGYIFAFASDTLTLQKAVSGVQAKRAVYINDYLYIVGENKIVVVDEKTWETVKELSI